MFDFDATLPCMAIQFLLLTFVMNQLFFKPLSKVLDDRDDYIRTNNTQGREQLKQAEQLALQYEQELSDTRREAQNTIAIAQEEAQKATAQQIAEAQREVQAELMKVQQELDTQKQAALSNLEQDVSVLSQQILEKLLGAEFAT